MFACSSDVVTGACGSVFCGSIQVGRIKSWSVDATADVKTWSDSSACVLIDQANQILTHGFNYVQSLPGNRKVTGTADFIYIVFPTLGTLLPQDNVVREGECCSLCLGIERTLGKAWIVP